MLKKSDIQLSYIRITYWNYPRNPHGHERALKEEDIGSTKLLNPKDFV